MSITSFQREICRAIARNRIDGGESYVAGGVALNTALDSQRVSRDIDLFHDTQEALSATWDADRRLLEAHGYEIEILRERPAFVEAIVRRGAERVAMEWVCDSAFRFFPLVEHPDFGMTLHPFDLATNKVLALVGRLEVRDWIDVIACSERLQHLGHLAWAACGKDPGFSPAMILAEARRSNRHTRAEIAGLAFEGPAPDVADLSRRWIGILEEADAIVGRLPVEHVGTCVLAADRSLFRGGAAELERALEAGSISFHHGRIRGALPSVAPV